MKEHFNSVNSLYDGHKSPELFKTRIGARKENEGAALKESINDTGSDSKVSDDFYNGRMQQANSFDDAEISGMDFAAAMDSIKFISDMGKSSEGRQAMSRAHKQVNPDEIVKLFGL